MPHDLPRIDELQSFIDFMKRFIKNAKGNSFFFAVDDLRIHHGKMVTLRKRAQE
jgi:hypothetical protein